MVVLAIWFTYELGPMDVCNALNKENVDVLR